jgi:hypothetical protein
VENGENSMSAGKYSNRAFVSNAAGAYAKIAATDFGSPVPAAPVVTLAAGSGVFSTGTAAVEVTWVTAEGVSLASASSTIATVASDGLHVARPSLPAAVNGTQNVIGWQIYSAGSTGTPAQSTILLNTASTTPAAVAIPTTAGPEIGFLVATTTVLLGAAGTGAAVPTSGTSGIQAPLPSVPANSAVDYYAVVPNSGSQWKQQKAVDYMNPDGIPETLGIVLNHLDFIQPVYPGAANEPQGGSNPPSSTYTRASVANGTYMVMNGYLFEAVQASTTSTAATFIGFSAFNKSKGSTTTDGFVTWESLGKAGLVRFQFSNVSTSTSTPAARGYELFQL